MWREIQDKNYFSVADSSDDGTTSSIEGSAKVKDPAEPAKLEVSFYESKKKKKI